MRPSSCVWFFLTGGFCRAVATFVGIDTKVKAGGISPLGVEGVGSFFDIAVDLLARVFVLSP